MTIRKVFKSTIPSVNYFFRNGLQGAFMLGRLETDVEYQIAELNAEVKSGHPHIYIDKADFEVDSEAPTALEVIKAEALAQARAELAASMDVNKAGSFSSNGDFKASLANTANIAEAAMGSDTNSASMAAAASVPTASGASLMTAALANLKK